MIEIVGNICNQEIEITTDATPPVNTKCGCNCEKEKALKICECVPKCTKKLEIFIDKPNVSGSITISKNWFSIERCYKFQYTTDANGVLSIDIPKGFLVNGWTHQYKYFLSIFDSLGNPLEFAGDCLFEFCITNCNNENSTHRLF